MTKEQAIHQFWSSFGIPAYDENSVPDDAVLPYITYSVAVDGFDRPASLMGQIWYKDTSWQTITEKSEEIARRILNGGEMVHYDGGAVWINSGTPLAQRVNTQDATLKRIAINIEAEYIG